ncbi:MAG: ribonuclease P protein component [Bacteroidetes bacterium]|nr:ribonuclease P protein component [Bacteroidota bacterium]
MKFTFKKEERLSSKKQIEELFAKGSYFYLFPFKVVYLPANTTATQVLISVSARTFKKAVDRNLIKRRIRESYRLQKHELGHEKNWLIAYIYTPKKILESKIIHQKMLLALEKLKSL